MFAEIRSRYSYLIISSETEIEVGCLRASIFILCDFYIMWRGMYVFVSLTEYFRLQLNFIVCLSLGKVEKN